MITTTTPGGVFPPHAPLYPPPLLIHKKPHRATFRRRIFRKSTQSYTGDQYVLGPLDDIIDEIKSDIWESPPDYSFDSSVLDWANPLKAPPSWAVTPLPVSRTPGAHPLTIRKNRNSRSSASGSSFGDAMAYSRNNSQEEPTNSGAVGSPHTRALAPWPSMDATSYEPAPVSAPNSSESSIATEHLSAQQALENVISNTEGQTELPKRRGSKLRLLTNSFSGFNGFSRLRRQNTGDTIASVGDSPDSSSPTVGELLATLEETHDGCTVKEPGVEAVEAYIRQNARNGPKLSSLMARIAKQLPPPTELDHEGYDAHASDSPSTMPTTLRAAVRVFPEAKILSDDIQEISIAVDIEGVLHNRKPLPDTTIDVVFVVDNGYYVTDDCIDRSLSAVNGALYHMSRGDRVALYTTHCTHHAVTGNRPDMHYPIRPFCVDTEETFRELTTRIGQFGTQVWDPPRPNPTMTDVILGIARSIEGQDLKTGRTHVILLSPAAHVLHDVSKNFPDLYIHRISPAALPYRRDQEFQDAVCLETCCKNVFASNWSKYQSTSGRIKRILKNARSEKPVGELTGMTVDIRMKDGCELIKSYGNMEVAQLFPGQVHTLFVRVRVTKAETQAINLESNNPILKSALDYKGLRQELLNVVAVGASKVHLLDVQVLHQNSLHPVDHWSYTETPLILIRELGGLAPPLDTSMELYKRLYFYQLTQSPADMAKVKAGEISATVHENNEQAAKLIKRMSKELEYHVAIKEYEQNYRQKLPLCPGPIDIESSPSAHEWLTDLWNRKKTKREFMAGVQGEDIGGLTGGINRQRLG